MKKVLIVDDEVHIQISLRYMIEEAGYQVFTASDGVEGLEIAKSEKPDLIFLDLMMPVKNGFETCKEIKEDPVLKDIYIILLTARGQEEDKKLAKKIGANEFVTKPFSPMNLVKKIKNILG